MVFSVCIAVPPPKKVSLQNVGTSYSPYVYWSNADNEIGFNYPHTLDKYRREATWMKVFHNDGSYSLKDHMHGYCMQYKDLNARLYQNPCIDGDENMVFDEEPVGRNLESLLIRFRSNGHCLYASPEYINAGPCEPDNSNFHWKFIAPIYRWD